LRKDIAKYLEKEAKRHSSTSFQQNLPTLITSQKFSKYLIPPKHHTPPLHKTKYNFLTNFTYIVAKTYYIKA